ncbi:MAG: cytochrome c [Betaproteobacteria bacterium]|nr:cytochrome c [Betaproteobacteria bacterium]
MNKLIAIICCLLLGVAPALAGDAAAGKDKSKTCAACHGPEGNTPAAPDFPRLAGQHYDYLVKAISAYQSGARKSPVMMPMVEKLSKRDIEDLAEFYSRQQGLVVKY